MCVYLYIIYLYYTYKTQTKEGSNRGIGEQKKDIPYQ